MEVQNVIMICGALYCLNKYMNHLFDPKKVTKQITEKKKIQYLVNNREINVSHHIYYLKMLGLYEKNRISNVNIREASIQRLNEIEVNNNKEPCTDELDIKAANSYIRDEWAYFIRKN